MRGTVHVKLSRGKQSPARRPRAPMEQTPKIPFSSACQDAPIFQVRKPTAIHTCSPAAAYRTVIKASSGRYRFASWCIVGACGMAVCKVARHFRAVLRICHSIHCVFDHEVADCDGILQRQMASLVTHARGEHLNAHSSTDRHTSNNSTTIWVRACQTPGKHAVSIGSLSAALRTQRHPQQQVSGMTHREEGEAGDFDCGLLLRLQRHGEEPVVVLVQDHTLPSKGTRASTIEWPVRQDHRGLPRESDASQHQIFCAKSVHAVATQAATA